MSQAGNGKRTEGKPDTDKNERSGGSADFEAEKTARLKAMDRHLAGLALSGGGIRSATFALGVVQGLADQKLLGRFDYLSTVSGGGYVGGWLAAWIKRSNRFLDVQDQLSPSRIEQSKPDRPPVGPNRIVDEEPEPIHHLRAYSNYLTPRPGLLSVDTWTLLVIYIRNALINLLLIVPLAMLLVVASRILVWYYTFAIAPEWLRAVNFWSFAVMLCAAVLMLGISAYRIHSTERDVAAGGSVPSPSSQLFLLATVIAPLIIAAALGCWTFSIAPPVESVRLQPGGSRLKGGAYDDYALVWMPALHDADDIAQEGEKQIIVADVKADGGEDVIHFRVFDEGRNRVVDAAQDQDELTLLASPIGELKGLLAGMTADRPLGPQEDEEVGRVISAVTSIVDHPHFETRVPDRPAWVHNLQPYVDETPFWFLRRLPEFDEDAYRRWYVDERFLWLSSLESGLFFGIISLAAHLLGYAFLRLSRLDSDSRAIERGEERSRLAGFLKMSSAAFLAGFSGGFFFMTMMSEVLWRHYDRPWFVITVGPPLALLVFVSATFIEVWLLSRWHSDGLREWWARVCAWLAISACAWLAFFAITLYGPLFVHEFLPSVQLKSGVVLGWLATAIGGAVAGRRSEADLRGREAWLKALVAVAPPVFVVGLLVGVAMLVDLSAFDWWQDRVDGLAKAGVVLDPQGGSASWLYLNGVLTTGLSQLGRVAGVCILLALIAGLMSNVNLFSLNAMYASRLTRCYLGASRKKREWSARGAEWKPGAGGAPTACQSRPRQENPVTGFDPEDDIPLWKLEIGRKPEPSEIDLYGMDGYLGPQLIINTALNLVSGAELAWQDRNAESFVLTPTFCGSKGTGYARSTAPTGRELTLGRAVSISGAAVDSNVGLHQSSALIALMTALNARLGWWMKNPRFPGWDAASPSVAWPLIHEMFGWTDEKKKYIHMSDGGHFENLGVYELVRRRCRYIVCCDAGTDPGASDDNLANMVRLCRTDFGVRIEVDTAPFARDATSGLSRWHCAVGRIHYDDVDGGELPGIFVLLRTSLTGDEPSDVQEYASRNPKFPWQSTADQFFDEPQFESYRALGFHVAQSAFKDALDDVRDSEPLWSERDAETEFRRGNQRLFSAAQRRWAPAPPNQSDSFLTAADAWIRFQKALRRERELAALSGDIYPEQELLRGPAPSVAGGAPRPRRTRGRRRLPRGPASSGVGGVLGGRGASPEIHAVAEMIQVMETAWVELRLSGFRNLPMNRGWMSVFRRWSGTDAMRRCWPVLRSEYSQDFVRFCENELGLGVADVPVLYKDLDVGFWRAAIDEIAIEYKREWPDQKPLDALLKEAEECWGGGPFRPLWLLVQVPGAPEKPPGLEDGVPCGVVFGKLLGLDDAGGDDAKTPRYEVFIWVRRAYRSMGIASRCARRIMTDFSEQVRSAGKDGLPHAFTIEARYPFVSGPRGNAMDLNLWKTFFGHFDFRRPPKLGQGHDGRHWVVTRTFGLDEF